MLPNSSSTQLNATQCHSSTIMQLQKLQLTAQFMQIMPKKHLGEKAQFKLALSIMIITKKNIYPINHQNHNVYHMSLSSRYP